jgi:hypothetical protein
MVTNGYFLKMDIALLAEFMEGYMSVEKMTELAKGAMSLIINKILKNCRKFKVLKMRKEDAVVLWFLSAYKHGKCLNCDLFIQTFSRTPRPNQRGDYRLQRSINYRMVYRPVQNGSTLID